MPPTVIMSPITFKRQVEQLVTEVTRCIQLCQDIRAYRNISSRPENLDRLQSTLESAEESIPMAYGTTRRLVGTQLEIGDERSRIEMDRYIVDLQTKIKPKLRKIAYPAPKLRQRHEREQPGFRDILNQWKAIYQEVSQTMLSLSRRIELAGTAPAQPSIRIRTPSPPLVSRKTDEITISLKEFDHLLQHMKNSWEETLVGGRYLYINVHDPSIKQWSLPANAYVKTLAGPATPRLRRSSSYERRSPRVRRSEFE